MDVTFALGGRQHAQLREHLFPGDGREGIALVLCGRGRGIGVERLVARRIVSIPHEALLHRGPDVVEWSVGDHLLPLVEAMEREDLALVAVHCRAPIPMGWSPHVGRHHYAMGLALYHLSIEDDGQGLLGGRKRPTANLERVRFILEVIVQPSLGHSDTRTTMRYLRWLSRVISGNGFGAAYAEYLGRTSSP